METTRSTGSDGGNACVHTRREAGVTHAAQAEGSLASFTAFSAFKQNRDSFENYTNSFACVF